MPRTYACYHDAIKKIIEVGQENKITIAQIIEHPCFVREDNHLEVADFKKEIRREVRRLIEEIGTDFETGSQILVEEKPRGRGQQAYYYWTSSSLKNVALGREEISEDRLMARAIAFQFVDEYLKEFLPPSIIASLEADMDEANDDLHVSKFWQKKLQFHPSGFEVAPNPKIVLGNEKDWDKTYDALNKQYVIRANYETLHKELVPNTVSLSLQKIQYINHKVMVLAFVHELNSVKTFEVARLKDIEKSSDYSFEHIDYNTYEKNYKFEARVNVSVKDYFKSVRFGHNFKEAEYESGDSWLIRATIKVPDHFSESKRGKPDPFAIANFLCGFGDSMEVIKPDFLRDEMKRRSENLWKLYSDDFESVPVISKSPHEQTGNLKKLNQINDKK
ncbi:WYL domain-containing protein [Litorilituus lipolyticus]|uniref:WYL domain-containing protein n=1 Tax=Litorilituus lipolyticus TaxID=2491017 RepID=A0A502L6A4_9GAMM|nr:WYL domain-containing protein [Litorilituus lipolyticus]TPH15867.1 WYL domain-containing protein [Litorilituus lipolyticus]